MGTLGSLWLPILELHNETKCALSIHSLFRDDIWCLNGLLLWLVTAVQGLQPTVCIFNCLMLLQPSIYFIQRVSKLLTTTRSALQLGIFTRCAQKQTQIEGLKCNLCDNYIKIESISPCTLETTFGVAHFFYTEILLWLPQGWTLHECHFQLRGNSSL